MTQFHADAEPLASPGTDTNGGPAIELPSLQQQDVDFGGQVMRDERGVYLAPEQSE